MNTLTYRQKWFGAAGGSKSQDQVRARILKAYNFMDAKLGNTNFFYPADTAKNTGCGGSTLAYVWKYGRNDKDYHETTGPRCNSFSDAGTHQCALDNQGHYIVYLCKYWYESFGDVARTSTVVHEIAHHTGPSDVTYDKSKMRTTISQTDQLHNAANYQNFGEDVTLNKWGCADSDVVAGLPYTCSGGPCTCGPFKDMCDDASHGAEVTRQCAATCGQCQQGSSPRRRRSPTPAPTAVPTAGEDNDGGGKGGKGGKIGGTDGDETSTAGCVSATKSGGTCVLDTTSCIGHWEVKMKCGTWSTAQITTYPTTKDYQWCGRCEIQSAKPSP